MNLGYRRSDPALSQIIGKHIKDIRTLEGISAREFSILLDKNPRFIAWIEIAVEPLFFTNLFRIAEVLGHDPHRVLFDLAEVIRQESL